MMDENLQVASTISPELTSKVLVLGINEVTNFGVMYKNAVGDYKNKYFRDRTAVRIHLMIATLKFLSPPPPHLKLCSFKPACWQHS